MRLRASYLIFIVALVCGKPGLIAQQQAPPSTDSPTKTQTQPPPNQEPPAASSPAPNPAPASGQTNQPQASGAPIRAHGEKASLPPKPPVLRRRARKSTRKKTSSDHNSPSEGQQSESGKVVVRNGGAKEGSAQIAPGASAAQAQHQRATAAELMATTDANLKRVAGRQLTSTEQGMLDEIHSYLRQAKAASDSGDTSRAETLAHKARLLSDELVARR